MFIKSTVVNNNVTFTHHSLTDSPRATSSPVRSALSRCTIFSLLSAYFCCTVSIFRYTSTCHCVTVPCGIQYSNMPSGRSLGAVGYATWPRCVVG